MAAGAPRLDGLPGCSPHWKIYGKRFRQTAKLALSLDLVTKISQHNHFRYFRHRFGSTFSRNPKKNVSLISNDAAHAMTFSTYLPMILAISGLSSAQP